MTTIVQIAAANVVPGTELKGLGTVYSVHHTSRDTILQADYGRTLRVSHATKVAVIRRLD